MGIICIRDPEKCSQKRVGLPRVTYTYWGGGGVYIYINIYVLYKGFIA